jgi:lipopolysaccharide transport system ATP-binding protein
MHRNMSSVIEVNGLNKKFCADLKRSMFYAVSDIGREILNRDRKSSALRAKEFWALKDVSFSIKRGQSVGLIGSNGAGKSTLLRILSGLIKPDKGSVKITGRVAPLIALGAGFNPILTGRENIRVNMAILGLSKSEINANFDAVVDFAELGHALDMPLQSYSSGMAARLGFACAIFTNPDILLIDEVLAVGDIRFRMKCYRKLAELRESETTFILVSHSAQSILSICDTAVYLRKGELVKIGGASEVTAFYEGELLNKTNDDTQQGILTLPAKPVALSGGADFMEIRLHSPEHKNPPFLVTGSPGGIVIKFNAHHAVEDLRVKLIVRELSFEGSTNITFDSHQDNVVIKAEPGTNVITLNFPSITLRPGLYTAKMNLNKKDIDILDAIESFKFLVKDQSALTLSATHFQPRSWTSTKEL